MASTRKKPQKAGNGKRGRPPTDVDWKGISVRFLPEEKALIAHVAEKAKLSQAEFIRIGSVKYAQDVKSAGEIVLKI